jgi:hypothetical protein
MTIPTQPNGNFYGENNSGNVNQETTPQNYNRPAGGKGKKAALIAGASVLTLGILAGGAYAVTNSFNAFSDKDIAKALPSNTAFFGEVDLDPSNAQKLGVVSVAQKVKDISGKKDIDPNKDPKEMVTDGFFKDLDFETEVKPWIGDKVAFGSWGDYSKVAETRNPTKYYDDSDSFSYDDSTLDESNFSFSDETGSTEDPYGYSDGSTLDEPTSNDSATGVSFERTSVKTATIEDSDRRKSKSDSSKDDGIHNVIVYEVKDEKKATEAATKAFEGKKEKFVVQDGYLIISENQEDIDAYTSDIKSGSLAENENFKSDKKTFDQDAIAVGWADMEKFNLGEAAKQYSSSFETSDGKDFTVKGRIISGVSLSQNKVSSVTKVIGFESNVVDTKAAVSTDGVKDLGNLPANSFAAVSVAGLDKSLKNFWEKNGDEIEKNGSLTSGLQDLEDKYGISIPEDFTKLVGTETAFGFATPEGATGKNASKETSILARLTGADTELYQKMLAESSDSDTVNISDDNGVTAIKYKDSGADGKLSDNAKFKDAVGNTKDSQIAAFADLDKLAELSGKEAKSYGVAGLNGAFDKDNNVSTITVNWSF